VRIETPAERLHPLPGPKVACAEPEDQWAIADAKDEPDNREHDPGAPIPGADNGA